MMLDCLLESTLTEKLEDIEYNLVLTAIKDRYGHDFNAYAQKSLKRRLQHHVEKCGFENITDMIQPILYDDVFFEGLLNTISVSVTDMYRDPDFFNVLRTKILPLLQTYPSINIWHAGCSTGEEVYSMAIMLEEEGLYENCHIYATDFNAKSLAQAKQGIYDKAQLKSYSENYQLSGGKKNFSDYYHLHANGIKIKSDLMRNITFASHNLTNDGLFGQFNLILCRNVLIYFGDKLQDRVFKLFYDSVLPLGYLCLGNHESLDNDTSFLHDTICHQQKIYRRRN